MEFTAILGVILAILYTIVYDIGKGEDRGRIIKGTFVMTLFIISIKSINKAYSDANLMNISIAIFTMIIFLSILLSALKAELPLTLQLQIYYYLLQKTYPIIQKIPGRILPNSKKEAYEMIFLSFPTRFREYLERQHNKIPNETLKREIEKVEKIEELPMGNRIPLVVHATHLTKKDLLPHFAFATPLIRDALLINKIVRGNKEIWNELEVTIDEKKLQVGIYNTAGKLFLKHYYFDIKNMNTKKDYSKNMFKTSKEIMKFLKQKTEKSLIVDTPQIFRWVSGGALPIVKWRNKYWVVTFFRHIEPVGLNIPLGSSESEREYLKEERTGATHQRRYNIGDGLNRLSFREFSEEVMVLNGKPQRGSTVNQKLMNLIMCNNIILRSDEFVKKH